MHLKPAFGASASSVQLIADLAARTQMPTRSPPYFATRRSTAELSISANSPNSTRSAPRANNSTARASLPAPIATFNCASDSGKSGPSSTKHMPLTGNSSALTQRASFNVDICFMGSTSIENQLVVHKGLERTGIVRAQQ